MKPDQSKLKQKQEDLFDYWLKIKTECNQKDLNLMALGKECYQKGFTDALLYMINMQVYGIPSKEK